MKYSVISLSALSSAIFCSFCCRWLKNAKTSGRIILKVTEASLVQIYHIEIQNQVNNDTLSNGKVEIHSWRCLRIQLPQAEGDEKPKFAELATNARVPAPNTA